MTSQNRVGGSAKLRGQGGERKPAPSSPLGIKPRDQQGKHPSSSDRYRNRNSEETKPSRRKKCFSAIVGWIALPGWIALRGWIALLQHLFPKTKEEPSEQLSHLSSSNSGGSPSLSGTQTPSFAGDAESSGTTLISGLQSSPSPDASPFQDPELAAVPDQTHGFESTELPFQQTGVAENPAAPNQTHCSESTDLLLQQRADDPATPETGYPQVLPEGEGSGAPCLDHDSYVLESIDKYFQELQDSYYFCTHCGWGKLNFTTPTTTAELNVVDGERASESSLISVD